MHDLNLSASRRPQKAHQKLIQMTCLCIPQCVWNYLLAGEVGKLQSEFAKRGVKLLALSCNDVASHKG